MRPVPKEVAAGTIMKYSLIVIETNYLNNNTKIRIMKKIILSAAFLALAGFTTVNANEITKEKYTIAVRQDSTTKTPVELKDLPDSVKATLASEPVKAWTPTAAFLVTNADKTSYYLVNVKKDAEEGALKIDKDGKIIQ